MPSAPPDAFGCVLWTGRLDPEGYGFHGRSRAHIHAYVQAHGPVGVDKAGVPLVLDHGCNRRNCVAPHHLEAVTQSENLKRRRFGYRAKLARCPRGHDFNETRIVMPNGGCVCRTCNQEARRA